MPSTFWTKVAPLSIGAAIASTALAVVTPLGFSWLWKRSTIDPVVSRADAYKDLVVTSRKESTPQEWWGSYEFSSGYEGCRIELGPSGFYYAAFTCLGTPEVAYGKIVSVDGGHIRLHILEHEIVSRDPADAVRQRFRMSAELYSVPWDEEHFLIPAEQMVEFCSLVQARGWEAMDYAGYPHKLRQPGGVFRSLALAGLPDVPDEFRKYLRE